MTEQQAEIFQKLFKELSLTELSVEEEGMKLCMKKEQRDSERCEEYRTEGIPTETKPEKPLRKTSDSAVKAPLLGIFHRAPAPGEAPFVEEGVSVKKGDVLCIIEAMKMMNEITAGYDGVITEICAKENEIVEYGENLLRMTGGKHES